MTSDRGSCRRDVNPFAGESCSCGCPDLLGASSAAVPLNIHRCYSGGSVYAKFHSPVHRHHLYTVRMCPLNRSWNVAVVQAHFTVFPLRPKYLVLPASVFSTRRVATITLYLYYARSFQSFSVLSSQQSTAVALSSSASTLVCAIVTRFLRPSYLTAFADNNLPCDTCVFAYCVYLTIEERTRISVDQFLTILCFNPRKWYLRLISTTIRARPFAAIVWTL